VRKFYLNTGFRRYAAFFLSIAICAALVLWLYPAESETVPAWSENAKLIVLDAGHGGLDSGTSGKTTGIAESVINLAVAKKCEALFGFLGVDVRMTRTTDSSVDDGDGATIRARKREDLQTRTQIANSGCDALISIHMNAFPNSKYRGFQVFYSQNDERSVTLAETIQTAQKTLVDPVNVREVKALDRSVYLMKNVQVPAVIVECGFLSNPEDEALLSDGEYQKGLATAICSGALEFLYEAA
jgi:N-acetylmuramoyl-L-alanine amidase